MDKNQNYECKGKECCHFNAQFQHCVFWLDYLTGLCDLESLYTNIDRFCQLKSEVDKNGI